MTFVITTGSNATGTAISPKPVEGQILEWVCPTASGTALFGPNGTATFTVTRNTDGGTVLAATAVFAPFRYAPRRLLVTEAGGTTFLVAGSATSGVVDASGIPSADYLTATITQGGTSVSGTVFMYYDRHRS